MKVDLHIRPVVCDYFAVSYPLPSTLGYGLKFVINLYTVSNVMDYTGYSFLPNSLVSILMYFSMSSTDEGYIPIFSYTKLFLVDRTRAITKFLSVGLREKLE